MSRLRWLLACAGVVVVFSAIQVLVASVAVLLIDLGVPIGLDAPDRALAGDGTIMILMVSDIISLAVAYPWYRRLRRDRWRSAPPERAELPAPPPGEGRPQVRTAADATASVADPQKAPFAAADGDPASADCASDRSVRATPEAPAGPRLSMPRVIVGAFGLGIGLQYAASGLLGLLVSFFPQAGSEYESMMESAGLTAFSIVALVSVVIIGPVLEETVYRGIEFYLARHVSKRFWIVNLIQATCFGVAHLNPLQGTYAFFIGLVLGMVYARTGRLWPSMLCHATVNLMSYAPLPFAGSLSDIGLMAAGAVVLVIFGFVADLACMQKT